MAVQVTAPDALAAAAAGGVEEQPIDFDRPRFSRSATRSGWSAEFEEPPDFAPEFEDDAALAPPSPEEAAAPSPSRAQPAEPVQPAEPAEPAPTVEGEKPGHIAVERPHTADVAPVAVTVGGTSDELSDRENQRRERRGTGWLLGAYALPPLAVLAVSSGEAPVALVVPALAAAPLVHFANGRVGRGFGALGGQVGMPLGGALVLGLASDSSEGAVLGATLGYLGWVVIDVVALSKARWREREEAKRGGLAPLAAVTDDGLWGGIGGTF